MKREQLHELVYQMLETERGGIQVYTTALACVVNEDLRKEWEGYLEQTQNHERIVLQLMEKLDLEPEKDSPGRQVVRHIGESLVALAGRALKGEEAKAIKEAYEEVEEEEDEYLYHTTGWCRELWIQSLGIPAVLPPPAEEKEVKTAFGAARAKAARREML